MNPYRIVQLVLIGIAAILFLIRNSNYYKLNSEITRDKRKQLENDNKNLEISGYVFLGLALLFLLPDLYDIGINLYKKLLGTRQGK